MWTREETELLKTQYKNGFTADESARIIGKTRLDVINKLISLGMKPITADKQPEQVTIFETAENTPQRKPKVSLTPDIIKRVCKMRREGRSFASIAKETGVSKSSISRILKHNNFDSAKIYEKEPVPVAAETSPKINLSNLNYTTSHSFGQEQLKQIKAILQSVDYCTMAKVGQSIGEAIGRIDTLINFMEAKKHEAETK